MLVWRGGGGSLNQPKQFSVKPLMFGAMKGRIGTKKKIPPINLFLSFFIFFICPKAQIRTKHSLQFNFGANCEIVKSQGEFIYLVIHFLFIFWGGVISLKKKKMFWLNEKLSVHVQRFSFGAMGQR